MAQEIVFAADAVQPKRLQTERRRKKEEAPQRSLGRRGVIFC